MGTHEFEERDRRVGTRYIARVKACAGSQGQAKQKNGITGTASG